MFTLAVQIPDFLEPRITWNNLWGGMLLIASFVVLSVVNLMRPKFYLISTKLMLKTDGIVQSSRESLPIFHRASILLYVNFVVSSFAILLLIAPFLGKQNSFAFNTGLCWVVFNVFNLFSLFFTSFLAGSRKEFIGSIYFKLTGVQWLGIAYFIIGVCWYFSKGWDDLFIWGVIALTSIEFFVRIIKSFFNSLQAGSFWYYIILYLCTLEILPLLALLLMVGWI